MSLDRSSLFSLEGKTAVLTGAASFLGPMFAEALLAHGARVVALDRSETLVEHTAIWADRFGKGSVRSYRVDRYDRDVFDRLLERIAQQENHIDILVNNTHEPEPNTGLNPPGGFTGNASYRQWNRDRTAGVYWPALAIQRIAARMTEAKRGSIVNISPIYGFAAPEPSRPEGTSPERTSDAGTTDEGTAVLNPPDDSAPQAALASFTRYVAGLLGPHGVRANAILPGAFSNTEDAGPNTAADGNDVIGRSVARMVAGTCLDRIGQPRELAGALVFLASDASSYMTGQSLIIDGGYTAA